MFMYRWIQHDKYIVTECWSMKLEHFSTTLCEFIKISHSDSRVYTFGDLATDGRRNRVKV